MFEGLYFDTSITKSIRRDFVNLPTDSLEILRLLEIYHAVQGLLILQLNRK